MSKISLLDCTLRDGGYVNDWQFGKEAIPEIIKDLEESKVDILEIGFFKDEKYFPDRTVFNDAKQFAALVKNKIPSIKYAAMIEVVNPLPLELLDPCDGKGADIIRVIIWKRMLDEGFEYCKGIVEKGYKLCVQPARVDQYSDEEFVNMVKRFSQLDPMAIYVVDSWGSLNSPELLKYMHLADENMPEGCSLGYHGHNTLMQASCVAQDFIHENFKRNIIIDASIFGIGRGAGNLNTELIAKYLNENTDGKYNVLPMLKVYDKYIKAIYNQTKWGYSVPFLMAATYHCNPNFASYYGEKLRLPTEHINGVLASFGEDEKIIYSQELADKKLEEYFKKKSKLAIIIPTCDRAVAIESLLCNSAWQLKKYGIDLIIYDSSSNDETEALITNFHADGCDNVYYHRYEGKFDGFSLDHKLVQAYKDYVDDYDYIWLCRDGLIVTIDNCYKELFSAMNQKCDCIFVDASFRNGGETSFKKYVNCVDVFKDHAIRAITLGTLIFSKKMIKKIIKEHPITENNYSLWQMAVPFEYFATNSFVAISIINQVFSYNILGTSNSFWNANASALKQWSYYWFHVLNKLPPVYDDFKKDIFQINMFDFNPFSPSSLLRFRANGGLDLKLLFEHKVVLKKVMSISFGKVCLIAIIPKRLAKYLLTNLSARPVQCLRKISHCIN